MINRYLFFALLMLSTTLVNAQKYFTKTGQAYFISHTDVIDIDGTNNQVVSFIDFNNGEIACALLVKAFEFTLATAYEHFNETYMESHLYPKSNFKGKIIDIDKINIEKKGTYDIKVTGDLTIHGVTKNIQVPAKIEVVDKDNITGKCQFDVAISDYNIKVPKVVEDRVAKIVNIKLNFNYKPYKN